MMALERGRLGAYGICILFAALRSTSAEPVTLWDAISTNGSFSILLDCIQKADSSITVGAMIQGEESEFTTRFECTKQVC